MITNLCSLPHRQKGLSLIEVMISLVLGLFLIGGLMDVLTNSSNSYRLQDAMLRMQENGQFAMEHMARDIRSADFWGCLKSTDDLTSLLDPTGSGYTQTLYDFSVGIDGTENASGSGSVVAGTDTITVKGSTDVDGGRSLQAPYGPSTSDPLHIGSGSNLQSGDILVVSDCLDGNIFQASAVASNGTISFGSSGSPGNISPPQLSKVFAYDASIFQAYSNTYSIRTGSNGLPSLFLSDMSGDRELVEGIESMVIYFGEDTDGDGNANRYVRANSVTDMNEVVSVRINLLVHSLEDNLTTTLTPYTFNNQIITPADYRLRRVYTLTVTLRNRTT